MAVLAKLMLFLNSVSSIIFAAYAYLVLWGPIGSGSFIIPMINPPTVSFSSAIYLIALPAMAHVLFEVMGPLVRSPGNVFLYFCSFVSSIPSIAVPGYAYVLWPFPGYEPTLLQWGALVTWGPGVIIEILMAGISARLLQRSWFGESAHAI